MAAASILEPTNNTTSGGSSREFLDSFVGDALRRASTPMMTDFADAIHGTDMRPTFVSILSIVDENPGINQGAGGAILGIARANIAPLASEHENRKFLRRTPDDPDDNDRRAISIVLPPAGKAMLADCKARIKTHEKRILKRLTAAERTTLLRLVRKI